MKPSNAVCVGSPAGPDDPIFICPLCDCEADRPEGLCCPECHEKVIPDPEDAI